MNWIIEIVIFLLIIFILILINEKNIKKKNKKNLDMTNIQEINYQKYAQFFGHNVSTDENYENKMNIIYDLITNYKEKNIKKIAKKSKCSIDECILKIKYLKTNDLIDNYVIDYLNHKLVETTLEEKTLVLKYSEYLYKKNLQIPEMAQVMPRTQGEDIQQMQRKIYNDLINLYDKSLLDNLTINKETGYINYCQVDKKN